MSERRLGIIMNGVTGRMGTNQHLIRSVLALRAEGGVRLKDGSRVVPEPVLVGRDRAKLEQLARTHGLARIATDLGQALAERGDAVYFDAVNQYVLTNVPTSLTLPPVGIYLATQQHLQSNFTDHGPYVTASWSFW